MNDSEPASFDRGDIEIEQGLRDSHNFSEYPLPKYKVGDTVRVSKYKSIFTKGYEANFTEELFRIHRVFRGDPSVYEIEDLDGEPIIGKFYGEELSAVDKKDDVYRVEGVLKRKK